MALATAVLAQQTQSKRPQVKYSGRLTSAHAYRLRAIEGQAVYGEVSDKGELVSASAVRVALFNRKDKHLVASVPTEVGGQFKFAGIAPGKYVLVVSVSALHEINIPVEVSAKPGRGTFKRWSGKEPVLYPIEDEANVDKRRMKIGLPPLREYLETLKRQYFPQP